MQKIKLAGLSLLSGLCLINGLASAQQPLTQDSGAPVGDNQNSKTVGKNGPVLLEDFNLIEKLSRFDRERIPERVVHARGTGAHGVFTSYGNFSELTKASFLNTAGKETPVFVRFSTVIHSKGSTEMARDPRGFSVKFYTDQGNYDLVMNNLPVFFIRDGIKFPDFIHALKPSPVYNKQDPNRVFDFISQSPESTHMITQVYSDLGIPASYRKMPGHSVHAFKWINKKGEATYIKYKFTSLQGIETLTLEQAKKLSGENAEAITMDLYKNIEAKNYPSWEVSVQTLKPGDLNKFDFNPLDATKDWPENLVPATKIGKMTLNRVPDNFFLETEQSAFDPGVLVPGIEPSEDKLLQGRLFSYADTQRYRIGTNYQALPINRPKLEVGNNNQDGSMNAGTRKGEVNYEPSLNAPYVETPQYKYSQYKLSDLVSQEKIDKPNDFQQAGEKYRSYTAQQKTNLIHNLMDDLKQVKNPEILYTMASHFYKADSDYGSRVAQGLKLDMGQVKSRADKLK